MSDHRNRLFEGTYLVAKWIVVAVFNLAPPIVSARVQAVALTLLAASSPVVAVDFSAGALSPVGCGGSSAGIDDCPAEFTGFSCSTPPGSPGFLQCDNGPGVTARVEVCEGGPEVNINCDANSFRCCPALAGTPFLEKRDPNCNPNDTACEVEIAVPVQVPGTEQNFQGCCPVPVRVYWFETATPSETCEPRCNDECGQISKCGFISQIKVTQMVARLKVGDFSCTDLTHDTTYSLSVFPCESVNSCPIGCPDGGPCEPLRLDVPGLSVDPGELSAALGCEPRPPMDDRDDCKAGTGGDRGISVGGDPPANLTPAKSGPDALLRYTARGVGHSSYPGAGVWNPELGRYWSHDYAERIVIDPDVGDETHVWLLTKTGTFREFRIPDGSGVYRDAVPSDEYRTLTVETDGGGAVTGWTLRELDGTLHSYDDQGRWTETAQKGNSNNRIWADPFEVGTERLTTVNFSDGRKETFTYHTAGLQAGKLATISEVGVGGSPSRIWVYKWDDDGEPLDLDRITRPDGTAWRFYYTDSRHAGYMTRMELVGADGTSVRVIAGWVYDDIGNVVKTWRGHTLVGQGADAPGDDAVEVHELEFDSPAAPMGTTVKKYLDWPSQDPDDVVDTDYQFQRDTVSQKPFVTQISGTCPVCDVGPDTSFVPCDGTDPGCDQHPLRVFEQTDGRGSLTRFTYNEYGQVETETEAVDTGYERTTTWTYDPVYPAFPILIQVPSTSGTLFRETAMSYDSDTGDMKWRKIRGFEETTGASPPEAFEHRTDYTYNNAGMVLRMDGPLPGTGDLTEWQYDGARGGLIPTKRIDPVIGFLGTTDYQYDVFNRLVRVTDPNEVPEDTQYDDLDRVKKVIHRAADGGDPEDAPLPGDLVTESSYDTWGSLDQMWTYRTGDSIDGVTDYGYEPAPGPARLIQIEQKPDFVTAGQRVVYQLDDLGNRTQEEHRESDGTVKATSRYEYEGGCRLKKAILDPDTAASTTEYAYDCNGNLQRVWDANHLSAGQVNPATQFYDYDPLNRLETITRPEGGSHTTQYEYDEQDHLTKVTDAEGNATDYVYSDRDLLTMQDSDKVSGQTTYTYNERGQLLSETDARSITIARTVDALDRLTSIDYPGGSPGDVYFLYDVHHDEPGTQVQNLIGRLVRIERWGDWFTYRYDRFGRVTDDGSLSYAYDGRGNRTDISYPSGVTATYTYDEANRQETLIVDVGGSQQTVVSAASYLPNGPLASLSFGNVGTPLTEMRSFDLRYFPKAIGLTAGSTALLDWSYAEIDHVGNAVTITDLIDGSGNRSYEYDPLHYFLTCAGGPWNPGSNCNPEDGSPYIWTYDDIGNRISETDPTGATDTYVYDTNTTSGNTPLIDEIQLGGGGSRDYKFGSAGHLDQITITGMTNDFVWGDDGRLARLTRTDGAETYGDVAFAYDGRSFLTSAEELEAPSAPGGSLPFDDGFENGDLSAWSSCVGGPGCSGTNLLAVWPLYDSAGLIHGTTTESGYQMFAFYLAGRPVAQLEIDLTESTSWTFLTTDHLGAPIYASDENGAFVWKGGFEPFGGDYSNAQGAGISLRLPGQWFDPAWEAASTGASLYYNVHRWYEYGTGRYTRVDPAGPIAGPEAGGAANSHPFVYGAANPLKYIDPFALSPQDGCCDCPEQLWSYRGVSGGIGLIWWGWERSEGSFTCLSKPGLKVEVSATCRLRGPQLFGGASFDFSFTKFFPGGRACNVEDLFKQTSTAPVGFQTIPIGAEGDPTNNTGLISFGIRPGAVVFPTKDCQFRPYESPF